MSQTTIKTAVNNKFKEKVISKIPDNFDLAIIGKIDLKEAEKIANEEIVFLSEEDLIDGLENYELIPIQTIKENELTKKNTELNTSEKISLKIEEDNNDVTTSADEVLFEDFTISDIKHTDNESIEKQIIKEDEDIKGPEEPPEEPEEVQYFENKTDELAEDKIDKGIASESQISVEDTHSSEDKNIIESDIAEEVHIDDNPVELLNESEILKNKIDENQFNHQLDDIVKLEIEEDHEFLPGQYDEPVLNANVRFIDDSHLEKKDKELLAIYESDPLTENLVKMVDIAEGNLIIFNEIAEVNERIEYLLDNRQAYEDESIALLFKQEQFEIDADFDFIDNAIIRDDYTVYIQEIDDFLRSRDSQSKSEIIEILGLLPEENEFIEEKLFGAYYSEFEEELDFEFINPELSFFDRGYVEKKELNYFINDQFGLLDEEKKSIEEDITSETAIIFEEDISEIKKLLEKSEFKKSEDVIQEEVIYIPDEEIIPDISDSIIILEDMEEIERITSKYPDKKDDLKKLLSYLDGLMEKLPEESIRKFAESEYYDLYVKVLKEIGI